jgi:hypothetical protein
MSSVPPANNLPASITIGIDASGKSQLDSISSSFLMGMARLQSLNNTRLEAFTNKANSLKKQQCKKSSIVGNFR